jgi:hypothetical protein
MEFRFEVSQMVGLPMACERRQGCKVGFGGLKRLWILQSGAAGLMINAEIIAQKKRLKSLIKTTKKVYTIVYYQTLFSVLTE